MKGALLMANDNQIAFLCSRLKELREKNGCTMDGMAKKIDVLEGLEPGTGTSRLFHVLKVEKLQKKLYWKWQENIVRFLECQNHRPNNF